MDGGGGGGTQEGTWERTCAIFCVCFLKKTPCTCWCLAKANVRETRGQRKTGKRETETGSERERERYREREKQKERQRERERGERKEETRRRKQQVQGGKSELAQTWFGPVATPRHTPAKILRGLATEKSTTENVPPTQETHLAMHLIGKGRQRRGGGGGGG